MAKSQNQAATFDSLTPHYGFKWCPGCGNFGILNAMKLAIIDSKLPQNEFQIVSDIGQAGKLPMWLNIYGYHGLHGRALPVAQGIKIANPKLKVLVTSGDGGAYAEGMAHYVFACRRNVDLTYLVHDNYTYGLTTGQASPTSIKGTKSNTTPEGKIEPDINPMKIAMASGATFIARAYVGEQDHLKWVIAEAMKHKGFAVIDILQPCVVFNKVQTWQSWEERVYKIEDSKHDPQNRDQASKLAGINWGPRIPIGIIYQDKKQPAFESEVGKTIKLPLVDHNINNVSIKSSLDLLTGKRI